ncbi:stromal cell-derived factor 2-like [Cimex lectularius]|uniref:MIR domain-containing protein n=1 Tax=Cimex lectularius TaxID=79782 RepID=A0A8I6RVC0_CIMLE|nr:stromal cell-derived factor 2-like [Cimex lectularius]
MKSRSLLLLFQFFVYSVEGQQLQYVTCGSVLKLLNVDHSVRLHSHDVNYGTGSGQQSVTGTLQQDDINSHWLLKGETKKDCPRGKPVKCGDVIRLQHLATNKNLHSHHFSSPLSDNQEVSAYGVNGEGDSGDHWNIICDGEFWEPEKEVLLRHVDTDVYLSVSGRKYGSIINKQMEVMGTNRMTSVHWKASEGIYIHMNDFNPKHDAHSHMHTEL